MKNGWYSREKDMCHTRELTYCTRACPARACSAKGSEPAARDAQAHLLLLEEILQYISARVHDEGKRRFGRCEAPNLDHVVGFLHLGTRMVVERVPEGSSREELTCEHT